MILITDGVNALFDTWIIGDSTLKDLAITYDAIKHESKKEEMKDRKPYLLRYYNVKTLYKSQTSGIKSAAT